MIFNSKTATLAAGLFGLLAADCAVAQLSPGESLDLFEPADGFEVALWASEPMVNNPTSMDIDSRGRVWIAEGLNYRMQAKRGNPFKRVEGADRIKILQDTDGDGRADKVTVFADKISPPPLGLAVEEIWQDGKYRGARVYVGNSPRVLVLEDSDGDDRADRRYALLEGFGGIDSDHGLHGMALGPDGRLYFTQGDARFGADKVGGGAVTFDVTDKSGRRLRNNRYGTTLRVDLDGSNFEVLGYRQRNNYGTSVDSYGDVFTSDNDDDGERGCRMIWLMDGGNYGYAYPGSDRQFAEELPGVVPKLVGTGNGAPTSVLVYEGDLFPRLYRGGAIQLDAGTHQVNFFPLVRHGAGFRSGYQVLLGSDDPWFRPSDAAVAPDGSLYLCDWYDAGVGGNRFSDQDTGRIFVVRPRGSQPQPAAADFATTDGLVEALKSPNIATRFAARQSLVAQGAASRGAVLDLFQKGRPHQRARALFVLAGLPGGAGTDLPAALNDADPRIRELALRILARDLGRESLVDPGPGGMVPPPAVAVLDGIAPLVDDPDAGVRRELILALRNVDTSKAGGLLTDLSLAWDGRDRYYLEALHLALRNRGAGFLGKLFTQLEQRALAETWSDGVVASPPFFPVATNDAYLHIDDKLPPANSASKLVGLAWVSGSGECLPALRSILEKNPPPAILRGVDMALGAIHDPRAAELLEDRFAAVDDPQRRREILRLLGTGLAGPWESVRDGEKTRRVFERALARDDLQGEAIKAIARSHAKGNEKILLELVNDGRRGIPARAAALETLGKLRYGPARAAARREVEQAKNQDRGGPLALAALSAVGAFSGDQARELFAGVMADDSYPPDFRRRAMQELAMEPKGGRQLVAMYTAKKLPADFVGEATFLLRNHPNREIRGLAREKIPAARGAGGAPITDLDAVLAFTGDAHKGAGLFRQLGCAGCHRVQGVGNSIGPDLSSVGTKYGKRELLYHILNPNGAINYNYVYYTFTLADGRAVAGLVADENPERVVLKTAQGQRIEIPADEIEKRQALNISIMPPIVSGMVGQADLSSLVAYLATLRQAVGTVGQYDVLGPLAAGGFDGSLQPDQAKTWPAAGGGKTRWQRVSASRDGYLDLAEWLGSEAGGVVYCFVPCVSPSAQEARIVVDTANPIQIWHRGQMVDLTRSADGGANAPWQGKLELQPGANPLMIRVTGGQMAPGLATTLVSGQTLRFDFDRNR